MNPINENNKLDALHTLYTGTTGSGKTSAVKKMGRIVNTDQAVFWDPHSDYQEKGGFRGRVVREYRNFKSFKNALHGEKNKAGL